MGTYTKVNGLLVKEENQPAVIKQQETFNALLNQLEPGKYKITVEPVESLLDKMKRKYFQMETDISLHLGVKKRALHMLLRENIGQIIDDATGKVIYHSITKITDPKEMQMRIEELHEFCARNFNYVFPPFEPEDDYSKYFYS